MDQNWPAKKDDLTVEPPLSATLEIDFRLMAFGLRHIRPFPKPIYVRGQPRRTRNLITPTQDLPPRGKKFSQILDLKADLSVIGVCGGFVKTFFTGFIKLQSKTPVFYDG